jgi:hypothetical protein
MFVPAARTPVTAADAVISFGLACKDLWETTKPETVAVLTAQSALESARWASMWNDNPSNIKNGDKRTGFYTCIKLNEVEVRDGHKLVVWYSPEGELLGKDGPLRYPNAPIVTPPGHPTTRMRAYATFADGIADKLSFLNKPHWAKAKAAALAGNPELYAHECGVAGYYTAPEGPYRRGVVSLFRSFLPIAQQQIAEPLPLPSRVEEQLCLDMADCHRFELPDWLRAQVELLLGQVTITDELRDEMRRERDAAIRDQDDGQD